MDRAKAERKQKSPEFQLFITPASPSQDHKTLFLAHPNRFVTVGEFR
jgi:hypothetical protein